MPKSKLKPCPFCGQQLDMIINAGIRKGEITKYHPCCHNEKCVMFTGGMWYKTEEEAIEEWNRRAETLNKWISVEERLPEDNQMCLVYGTVYYEPDEHGEEIFVTKYYKEFGFIDQVRGNITHWMPLPEPPKKEGAKP